MSEGASCLDKLTGRDQDRVTIMATHLRTCTRINPAFTSIFYFFRSIKYTLSYDTSTVLAEGLRSYVQKGISLRALCARTHACALNAQADILRFFANFLQGLQLGAFFDANYSATSNVLDMPLPQHRSYPMSRANSYAGNRLRMVSGSPDACYE